MNRLYNKSKALKLEFKVREMLQHPLKRLSFHANYTKVELISEVDFAVFF